MKEDLRKFCKNCPEHKKMEEYALAHSESAYDAVIDVQLEEEECYKTCNKRKDISKAQQALNYIREHYTKVYKDINKSEECFKTLQELIDKTL